jgi:hypothetical protein
MTIAVVECAMLFVMNHKTCPRNFTCFVLIMIGYVCMSLHVCCVGSHMLGYGMIVMLYAAVS